MCLLVACGPTQPTAEGETTGSAQTSMEGSGIAEESSTGSESESDSSSESMTEAGEEEEETNSDSFTPDPDLGSFPAPCDPFYSLDCPEGEKCVPGVVQGEQSTVCRPIVGDGEPGDPCEVDEDYVDTCGASSWCGLGVCRDYCDGTVDDPTCADPNFSCVITNDGNWIACMPACDPIMSTCAEGEGCVYTSYNNIYGTFTCAPVFEPGGLNEPCVYINGCEPRVACTSAAYLPDFQASSCCSEFCPFMDPDAMCSIPGTSCESFWGEEMAEEGYEHVGLCYVTP